MDSGVGGVARVDLVEKVREGLVLREGDGREFVVVEERGDEVARVEVGLVFEDVDELNGGVRH